MDELVNALIELDEDRVLRIVEEKLESGTDPMIVLESCRSGMEEIGARFERNEYFLSELALAGEMFKQISNLILPRIEGYAEEKIGTVLIGTVEGDIHDIGKNIVIFMLESNGFEVIDIGVDIPPNVFVEKIKELKPDIVGLSGLLTAAFESMKITVDAIREAGLLDSVKIMIGGGQCNEDVRAFTGAHAYGETAVDAVKLCKKWIQTSN